MLDHLSDMVRVHGVKHCEEVVPIGISVGWIIILQILHYFVILLELRKDVLDAELVVLGHVHRALLTDLEQLLFTLKHSSDEVSVHGGHRGHKQLNYVNRVR